MRYSCSDNPVLERYHIDDEDEFLDFFFGTPFELEIHLYSRRLQDKTVNPFRERRHIY